MTDARLDTPTSVVPPAAEHSADVPETSVPTATGDGARRSRSLQAQSQRRNGRRPEHPPSGGFGVECSWGFPDTATGSHRVSRPRETPEAMSARGTRFVLADYGVHEPSALLASSRKKGCAKGQSLGACPERSRRAGGLRGTSVSARYCPTPFLAGHARASNKAADRRMVERVFRDPDRLIR